MPDSQGFATKEEVLSALAPAAASGQVQKVVACAGFVKIWLSPEAGPEQARELRSLVASRPGVQAVTLVAEGD